MFKKDKKNEIQYRHNLIKQIMDSVKRRNFNIKLNQ